MNALSLTFGPFHVSLRSSLQYFVDQHRRLYRGQESRSKRDIYHYQIRVNAATGLRRWYRPQVVFSLEGIRPFKPYPATHALPLFEWGLNWCIGSSAHRYLMLHAAVLERHGQALILPAMPGSGKSTLCAALANRGWRMLTDEIGLLRPEDGLLVPLPRAIPLKNDAIEVVKAFAPEAVFGPVFPETRKGTVVHMGPPAAALRDQHIPARPRWVAFPRFGAGAPFTLKPAAKSLAFTRLAHNSFNYEILGATSFHALGRLVQQCDCYTSTHSDLETACQELTELADATAVDQTSADRGAL
jgi:HprK-related kinase A